MESLLSPHTVKEASRERTKGAVKPNRLWVVQVPVGEMPRSIELCAQMCACPWHFHAFSVIFLFFSSFPLCFFPEQDSSNAFVRRAVGWHAAIQRYDVDRCTPGTRLTCIGSSGHKKGMAFSSTARNAYESPAVLDEAHIHKVWLPVVPHPLMDWKVVGVVFLGVVAMVAVAPHPQLLDVVWCSAAAVVVVM